ncbi:MAG: hypothetical protein Q9M97_08680 [Candidatus Gracilibacteria bacterium]|nr:hypothetical protein [Candidatus Gracilibacteria bacterium]
MIFQKIIEKHKLDEGELNYTEAVDKIDNQYKQIDKFLNLDTTEENKKYLNAIKSNLDNFVISANGKLKNLPENGFELFKEIAEELESHWPGVFVKGDEITKDKIKPLIQKFDFIEVKSGDTVSELIEKKYNITKYSEIESIITQLYLKNPDKINPGELLVLLKAT